MVEGPISFYVSAHKSHDFPPTDFVFQLVAPTTGGIEWNNKWKVGGWVGGWFGWIEEKEAVRTCYCRLGESGWVGGWVGG